MAIVLSSASSAMAYEWQLSGKAIEKPLAVKWTSTSKFEVSSGTSFAISCTIVHSGNVQGGKEEITSLKSTGGAEVIPCTITSSSSFCESNATIKAAKLPWKTELAAEGDVLRNKESASTEPTWWVECKGRAGGEILCGDSLNLGVHNVPAGVEEVRDSSTPKSNCSGSATVHISGREIPLASEGSLRVYKAPAEWQQSEAGLEAAVSVTLSGKMKVESPLYTFECNDTAEGTVGLGGNGVVTKIATSGCTGKDGSYTCEPGLKTTITAQHLSWNSELTESGESLFDVMKSGGAGAPILKLTCKVLGVTAEAECTGGIELATSNKSTGVEAIWKGGSEFECTPNKEKSTLSGAGTLTSTGGVLEATSFRGS